MRLGRLLALCLFGAAISSPARADDEEMFGAFAERVDDAELAELRGGFVWQGLDIKIGAELRSYISNDLLVQTNLSLTNAQVDVMSSLAPGVTALSPAETTALLGGGDVGGQLGLGGAYTTNDGQTLFVQRLDSALQNIIVNSANDLAIRQELDATIDIGNFGAFQAGMMTHQLGMILGNMAGLAGIQR